MKKFRLFSMLAATLFMAGSAIAAYTQPLGGSIFPLTMVTQPVTNLSDAYNEMLGLINAQVAPLVGGAIIPPTAITAGSAITLNAGNSSQTVLLSAAGGSTVTLPAATGSGVVYHFIQTAAAPSAPHVIKVPNSTDFMIGNIETVDSAVVTGYIAANSGTVATNSDTITLSATTTGGLSAGSWIDMQDVAANTWSVHGITSSSGTAATPFSAAQ